MAFRAAPLSSGWIVPRVTIGSAVEQRNQGTPLAIRPKLMSAETLKLKVRNYSHFTITFPRYGDVQVIFQGFAEISKCSPLINFIIFVDAKTLTESPRINVHALIFEDALSFRK